MQQLAQKILPTGVSYEWTGLQLDQIAAGPLAVLIFALGIVFVFLVLSAQYESFIDPLIVLLAVPAAFFGALGIHQRPPLPDPVSLRSEHLAGRLRAGRLRDAHRPRE